MTEATEFRWSIAQRSRGTGWRRYYQFPHPERGSAIDGKMLERLAEMAAAYLFHIAQNDALHDGNKRTAVLAAGEMTKGELTAWMRTQVRRT